LRHYRAITAECRTLLQQFRERGGHREKVTLATVVYRSRPARTVASVVHSSSLDAQIRATLHPCFQRNAVWSAVRNYFLLFATPTETDPDLECPSTSTEF
ncbi:hypothetical protein X777_01984, partial [Ooceraea biroi]